jgi:hypothetical protein
MKIKWYTFVGFYSDNYQPLVIFGKGSSPFQAARYALNQMEKSGGNTDVQFVEAFLGRRKSVLGSYYPFNSADILHEADVEEERNEIKKSTPSKLLLMVGKVKYGENKSFFESRLKGLDK